MMFVLRVCSVFFCLFALFCQFFVGSFVRAYFVCYWSAFLQGIRLFLLIVDCVCSLLPFVCFFFLVSLCVLLFCLLASFVIWPVAVFFVCFLMVFLFCACSVLCFVFCLFSCLSVVCACLFLFVLFLFILFFCVCVVLLAFLFLLCCPVFFFESVLNQMLLL